MTHERAPRVEVDDVEALSIFEFELPSLRTSVDLAEILAETVKLDQIQHPALRFAIDYAPGGVAENLVLRTAELLDILDRVCLALGQERIFEKVGRVRTPKDSTLRLAWDLRQARVAHRVKMRNMREPSPSWAFVREAYGGVGPFLREVLDRLEAQLQHLRRAGLGVRLPRNAGRKDHVPFTAEGVIALVRTADELHATRPADGTRG